MPRGTPSAPRQPAKDANKFVVFADLLGFSRLVEQSKGSLRALNPVFRSASWMDANLSYRSAKDRDSLHYRFEMFHRCIEGLRQRIRRTPESSLICFSDSAFIAVSRVEAALNCARDIHFNCFHAGVPVRTGLAKGSFRLLRFVSDSSEGVSHHTSQFVGTGVIRAYEAHRSGTGMRAFIHPNVSRDIRRWVGTEILRLNEASQTAAFEINYLNGEQPIPFVHTIVGQPAQHDLLFFKRLAEMRTSASAEALRHYDATFAALNRMRVARGRAIVPPEPLKRRSRRA